MQTGINNPYLRMWISRCKRVCYCRNYLEEEVSLGKLSLNKLLAYKRISAGAKYIEGAPVFVKGSEVLEYREDPPKLES